MTDKTVPSPCRSMPLLGEEDVLRLVRAPRTTRALARLLLALFGIVIAALAVVPWQQTSPAAGRVIAFQPLDRQQTIGAPVEGRVVRWHVQEGDRVREGDPLVDIADNDPAIVERLEREREAIAARIAAAEAREKAIGARVGSLDASREASVTAAGSRLRMARDRIKAAEESLVAAEAAKDVAELNHDRQSGLFEKGLASKRTLELAELERTRARTEASRALAALGAARAEQDALAADRNKLREDATAAMSDGSASKASAEAEIASGKAELARLDVRLARQKTQALRAPRDGTVLRLLVQPGAEMVKAGDALAIFVPDTDERAVEVWVEGNDVNLVTSGRRVRLQFEGWPAVQFSGWPSAAVGTYGGVVAFVDATDDGKGRFRAVVVPDPEDHAWPPTERLRQGTRANSWILLDRVRLGYELWRQLNGFPPSWPAAPDPLAAPKAKEGKK